MFEKDAARDPLLYCGAGIHPDLYADKVALIGPIWQKIINYSQTRSSPAIKTELKDMISKSITYIRGVSTHGEIYLSSKKTRLKQILRPR
jgi:hypothetical protein